MINLNFNVVYACTASQSVSDAIKKHNVIFSGTSNGCYSENGSSFIKFNTLKIWKGDAKQIYTSSVPCKAAFFKKSKNYLIYANKLNVNEHIDISYGLTNCSKTKEIVPLWKKNIKSAWDLLYAGQFSYVISELFSEDREIASLGKPIHDFTKKNKDN